jgi:sugar lactone lactonase YvrE
MKVDLDGNLYCTGPVGVWIIDPSGKHLRTVALEEGKCCMTNVGTYLPLSALDEGGWGEGSPNQQSIDGTQS